MKSLQNLIVILGISLFLGIMSGFTNFEAGLIVGACSLTILNYLSYKFNF